ncbi:MAG: dihydropteroate synthase [Bacteroidetes bacterium]|nr:dihydropteroate synthase [Bacteroidota bacterium]
MGFKNTVLNVAASLSSKGRLLGLNQPIVMGILNVTPDSFYSSSMEQATILSQATQMLQDGATLLDIGGASSRPGAQAISLEDELQRVLPIIKLIRSEHPDCWLSIDTNRANVAQAAVEAGADIVNDISAGTDPSMLATVAKLSVPYIAMHMQGTPETMQLAPSYTHATQEILAYLKQVSNRCAAEGIKDVVLDPGFGFGKTVAHNFEILDQFSCFQILGRPLLAGVSRKSMICRTLGISPRQALNGTTALNMLALTKGANILRVHDVREAVECVQLYAQLSSTSQVD